MPLTCAGISWPGTEFQQTDTAAACAFGAYCSGLGVGNTNSAKTATIGGTAGVTAVSITHGASVANQAMVMFECTPADGRMWGTPDPTTTAWTLRWEITVANTNLTWNNFYACRVSSGCVNQGTFDSALAAIGLGTTGVKCVNFNFNGTPQVPNAGDKLVIIYSVSSGSTMTQNFSYKPSQIIGAPLVGTPEDNEILASPLQSAIADPLCTVCS